MNDRNIYTDSLKMQGNAKKAAKLLKQLANEKRLMILCSLLTGTKSVGELTESSGLSHSAVSQHLKKMHKAGLVEYQKKGQKVFYNVTSIEAQTILSVLYMAYCK